ncbi:anthrax toxin-like adenylyl cyclase domain-containing protein [Spiroplasma ixodetis]|uniref:anthrax toxin-like adenylyl cyclase domain-containing protein n=1 Tax=Spiroplasma ixodetis TaxID=2141 RepID=UPI002574C279|nr:anthrax toxin-like adenylyl cyclase domain-containing protein [Spiroplasma ixodetis]WJG70414.1 hypothetical protein SIXOD_v1c15610 [Spiroplasma ixodetis Y32]
MEIYINKNVETCENNGVLDKHFQGFVKTAQEENVVIILRPVNPITKYLLPQKYPTKSSSIKNKSSDWGIQSGFIVALDELTFLSKIGLKDNETQTEKIHLLCKKFSIKLNKNNKDNKINPVSLKLKNNETILKITNEHFFFLLVNMEKFGIIDAEFFLDKIFVKCCQPKNKKNEIVLYLEKEKNNNTYNVYYIFALDEENNITNLNGKTLKKIIKTEKKKLIYFPVIVFCKKVFEEKKPLIPDYDLFAVCWGIDDAIKNHQPRIPTNSFAAFKLDSWSVGYKERYFNKIFKKPNSRAKSKDFEQDEEGGGNVLDKTKEFLDKLNKNLGYERGLKDELCPIHHTFELVNPYSKDFNENFYTFFLPNQQLLTDFTFPNGIKVDKQTISYFAVYEPFNDGIFLWEKFLEPFLFYIKTKGYYVPNNCFVKQTDFLGFANSFNPWVRKIREEQSERQKSNELSLSVNVEAVNSLENDKPNSKKIKEQLFCINSHLSLC